MILLTKLAEERRTQPLAGQRAGRTGVGLLKTFRMVISAEWLDRKGSTLGGQRTRLAPIHLSIVLAFVLFNGPSRAESIQLAGRTFELPLPTGMCALSEQRHKEQLDFARQLNPERNKLLLLIVPCDRLALYEPNADIPANTSLLFDTAQWDILLDSNQEPLTASNDKTKTIVAIKAGLQGVLRALNAARANGQRYPATGGRIEKHDNYW